mmetsp:Transcript_45798/g.105673  ORF Transcript_45798/g.105673 Transcript_45798/m.105673 type:complete len:90 (+) Transcript_45798:1736-2005(+)
MSVLTHSRNLFVVGVVGLHTNSVRVMFTGAEPVQQGTKLTGGPALLGLTLSGVQANFAALNAGCGTTLGMGTEPNISPALPAVASAFRM